MYFTPPALSYVFSICAFCSSPFFSLVSSDNVYFSIFATITFNNIFYSPSVRRFKFSSRVFLHSTTLQILFSSNIL